MITAEHTVVIQAGMEDVWDYVQDIRQWANLFPGCQTCEVISDNDSRWVIKVGAGGMVRTVRLLVQVDRWQGPERVDFSFKLESEPVVGGGAYLARRKGAGETEIAMSVRVEGSGSMAPMWEAISRPLLPQLAKSFAARLKTEIEERTGASGVETAQMPAWQVLFAGLLDGWRRVWRTLFARHRPVPKQAEEDISVSEQNKAVALKFIQAMGGSDGAAAAACLAPDAFTLAKGFGKFAGVRRFDTIVGTIDAFKTLLPTGLQPDIKAVIAEGHRVVVEFEGNATTCDGKPYCNEYCMVFTLADGKIKQVNEYFCTLRAEEVLWPLVAAMADEIPSS